MKSGTGWNEKVVSRRGAEKKVNREAAEVWSETREREHHGRNRGKGGSRVKLDLYSGHEKWRGGGREGPTDREIGRGEEGQRYISQGVQSMYCLLCNTLL